MSEANKEVLDAVMRAMELEKETFDFYTGAAAKTATELMYDAEKELDLVLTQESLYVESTAAGDEVRVDPTRMAQGVMTGIGFLGAGVIFKEGISVRGLTTAASIWTTSAIGVLMGSGLYTPAVAGTVATLGVLAAFRWIENRIPAHRFAQHRVRFERENVMPEQALRALLARNGFSISGLAYRLTDDGRYFEYRMTIRTIDEANFTRLSVSLAALPPVREFTLSPAGD